MDYLASRGDDVASRLVSDQIRTFVEQDVDHGGTLTDTVLAYAAADMSVTRAAEALHVHVNTARYRLARVAEFTGADMKRFDDLLDLLLAIKMSAAARRSSSL